MNNLDIILSFQNSTEIKHETLPNFVVICFSCCFSCGKTSFSKLMSCHSYDQESKVKLSLFFEWLNKKFRILKKLLSQINHFNLICLPSSAASGSTWPFGTCGFSSSISSSASSTASLEVRLKTVSMLRTCRRWKFIEKTVEVNW